MVNAEQARENELRRATLLVALREDMQKMAQHLYVTLGTVELPNNRLSGITNGFAWHHQRAEPGARLAYGIAEIKRLQQRIDRNGKEYAVYTWLLNQIGKGSHPSPTEQTLLDPLHLGDNEVEDWLNHVRLIRAQGLVQLLRLMTQARPIADEITQAGGGLRWS